MAAELEANDIDRLLILFGPNALTAREAYEIQLPDVNRDHFGKNHIAADNAMVRRVSMSILTALLEGDASTNPNQPTNVYVLLSPRRSSDHCDDTVFQRHDDYQLHPDCRTTIFRLRNINRGGDHHLEELTNCCRDLVVFKDLASLRLDTATPTDSTALHCPPAGDIIEPLHLSSSVWFESDVFVAGYKDAPVKGKTIWI